MEGWQEEWIKMLETVASEIERFFLDVSKEMNEAADAFIDFTEEIVEQVEDAMTPSLTRLDDQLELWVEPVFLALTDFEGTLMQAVEPVTQTVEPLLSQHPVCAGCRHYHGQVYSGNLLVCAMHPYGVGEASTCADKEAIAWRFPQRDLFDPFNEDQL